MPFQYPRWYRFDADNLPTVGGMYAILDKDRAVIYIGRTDDLKRRIGEHRNDWRHCMHRYNPVTIVFEVVASEWDRIARERVLIAEYDPPCNKTC